jgi:hypothetical protein
VENRVFISYPRDAPQCLGLFLGHLLGSRAEVVFTDGETLENVLPRSLSPRPNPRFAVWNPACFGPFVSETRPDKFFKCGHLHIVLEYHGHTPSGINKGAPTRRDRARRLLARSPASPPSLDEVHEKNRKRAAGRHLI